MRVLRSALSLILAFVLVAVSLDMFTTTNDSTPVIRDTITKDELDSLPVVTRSCAVSDVIPCNKSGSSCTKTYFFYGSGNYTMDFEFNAHWADVRVVELIETENGVFGSEERKIDGLTLANGEIMTSKSGGYNSQNGIISGSLSFYSSGRCLIEITSAEECDISFRIKRVISGKSFMYDCGLIAASGNRSVTFSWVGRWDVDSYKIQSDDGRITYVESSLEDILSGKSEIKFDEEQYRLSCTVNELNNGEKYWFRVCASVDGEWYYSVKRGKTPTASPQNVQAESENGEVRLSWDSVDGAAGYIVRSADGGIQYTEKTITENFFAINGLTVGEKRKFIVYAFVDGKWYASAVVTKTVE